MSESLLLNALFALIGLLFLAIGYRRGLLREVFVSAGLLAGAMLSSLWSARLGDSIAQSFDFSQDAATFVISMGTLAFGVVVLGYGGTLAALPRDIATISRGPGALLGVFNGALLFGLVLSEIDSLIADDAARETIGDAFLPSTLSTHIDWLLLITTTLMAMLIFVSLLAGRQSFDAFPREGRTSPETAGSPVVRKSPRLRWGRDDDKVEPGRQQSDISTSSFAFAETMAMAPVDESTWAMDRSLSQRSQGPEWLEIRPESKFGVVDSQTLVRCTSCGERLTERDGFCPRCGRARS